MRRSPSPCPNTTSLSRSLPTASILSARTTGALARTSRKSFNPLAKYGDSMKSGRCNSARSQLPRGVVSRMASIFPPARRICAASSQSSGPVPAITVRPAGSRPCALSTVCAPPAVMTPGKVQPGIGNGRSCEPVAMIMRLAAIMRALPPIETPTIRCGSRLHTVAPVTIDAPLALASAASSAPAQ